MTSFRDISGTRFGRLIAISICGKDTTGKTTWSCICDCGNTSVATMLNLVKGVTKSCGCLRHQPRKSRHDLTGKRFGSLVALEIDGPKHWKCRCDCGVVNSKMTVHLTHDHTRSCGSCRELLDTKKNADIRMRNSTMPWAKLVRSLGECETCGSTQSLHAHHILPFAEYPELTTWIDNGVCICNSCHREIHRLISSGTIPGHALTALFIRHKGIKAEETASLLKGGIEDLKKAIHYIQKLIEIQKAKQESMDE